MTTIDQQSHETAPAGGSSHPVSVDSARPVSAQLILDAVVAGYIHDISERHPPRPGAGDETASADRNRARRVS